MNIDWQARFCNRAFWLTIVPAVLLFIQMVAVPFGYDWDFVVLNDQLAAIINAGFAVLAILGVCADTSTEGFSDGTD